MQIISHMVVSLVYVTRFLAVGRLYSDLYQKRTEIFCEFVSLMALMFLQQYQYTDDKAAREVIEGAFIACLILIALANLTYISCTCKRNKNIQKHNQKFQKVEKHIKKRQAKKSIGQYVNVAVK